MCGRFTLTPKKKEEIEKRFKAQFEDVYVPRYNAAPSQDMPGVCGDAPGLIKQMHWGLEPVWIKAVKSSGGIINVRAENLATKPTFKSDLLKRRCLILADGFYEWQKIGSKKQPYRFTLKDGKLFAFAGIYEENEIEGRGKVRTFSLITTTPNKICAKVHNRMPVILKPKDEKFWLSDADDKDALVALLKPYAASSMKAYAVDPRVGNIRYDEVSLISKL